MEKKYNLGLELIRSLMCYAVVATHFWSCSDFYARGTEPLALKFVASMRNYAVPVFMLMTFYLSSAKFLSGDGRWLAGRFKRLIVPFVGWTLITFTVFKALTPLSDAFACTFRDLWLQQLLGTTKALGSQYWFQSVLIILTAYFAVLFRFVKARSAVWALVLTALAAVAAEYTGLNYWLFKDGIYEVRHPLGRVIPMMSYACLGILLGMKKDVYAALSLRARWTIAGLGFGVVALLVNCPVFVSPPGFFYRGLNMLAIAFALTAAFALMPMERVPEGAGRVLLALSRYSMGIYLVHIFLGRIITVFLFPVLGLQPKCFTGTFVIFAACWIFCVVLAKILPKPLKPLVE